MNPYRDICIDTVATLARGGGDKEMQSICGRILDTLRGEDASLPPAVIVEPAVAVIPGNLPDSVVTATDSKPAVRRTYQRREKKVDEPVRPSPSVAPGLPEEKAAPLSTRLENARKAYVKFLGTGQSPNNIVEGELM